MKDHDIDRLVSGTHADPFSFLGLHGKGESAVIRALAPHADKIEVYELRGHKRITTLTRCSAAGVFEGDVIASDVASGYRFKARYGMYEEVYDDTYRFSPSIGDLDLHLLIEGRHAHAYRILGAHVTSRHGIPGTRFAVWAPNATGVCVTGDFNQWNEIKHPMSLRGGSGIWELFVPGVGEGIAYKYAIRDQYGRRLPLKADPYGFGAEQRPNTASVVRDLSMFDWHDEQWMQKRCETIWHQAPMSIYEVHLGSWIRNRRHGFLCYDDLAKYLIPYVKDLGFTHLELLPVNEHPFDGSWGYQPIGLYAPTSRHGTPVEFKNFIEACHRADIGVILDWVPGHFPSDAHGLATFDGTHLYEHFDRRKGFHPDWNTLIFNFGRYEVANYLIANARFWLEEYHLDGLRVDAVASMLYLDYSRKEGEWIANADGGNQNWEAVKFLQSMNADVYSIASALIKGGLFTVAEESTAWPGITSPTEQNGLGFGFKWNMGWMNDTLEYMSEDPIYRRHHHHKMTFGIDYAFSENYILPLSHDEVVHGKGSLLARMPGDRWKKFANLRAYYAFMWAHPGKKLLFMGGEFGQFSEWQADRSLDWHLLGHSEHRAVQSLIRDLNAIYRETSALYQLDTDSAGFEWIDGAACDDNIFAFIRWDKHRAAPCVVVSNFSPVPHRGYSVGVPKSGSWIEPMNTDSSRYGGSGLGNSGQLQSVKVNAHNQKQSLSLTIPPLSTLILTFLPNRK